MGACNAQVSKSMGGDIMKRARNMLLEELEDQARVEKLVEVDVDCNDTVTEWCALPPPPRSHLPPPSPSRPRASASCVRSRHWHRWLPPLSLSPAASAQVDGGGDGG